MTKLDLPESTAARPIRWWPAGMIGAVLVGVLLWIRAQDDWPFQQRNLRSLAAILVGAGLLLVWWVGFSRARRRLRLGVLGLVLAAGLMGAGMFRISGVSGDLLPIVEFRWAKRATPAPAPEPANSHAATSAVQAVPIPGVTWPDYPQYLGPGRNAILDGPGLDPDWTAHPPRVLWRQPIGAAWSGFVVVGHRALTQEQNDQEECVTCYDVLTGRLLWRHADAARYQTTIAGEGPRSTPTVVSNRVYALGATGLLNCLDLATGQRHWKREITSDAGSETPDWGFSSSPLVLNGRVHVSAGGKPDRSMIAYDSRTGEVVWTAGGSSVSYSSPFPTTLQGVPQILMFNSRRITSHDASTGRVLWEYPWGIGQPHVAMPVVVSTNRVVFSSGYGVGSELLEIARGNNDRLSAKRVWKSNRMKAKFSNLIARDGFLYGLDDGILACVDLQDGSLRWKEGRYGHGQGLLVGDYYLLMAETGELILLQPKPEARRELARLSVFSAKTWNPIALAGPKLLVRNDREAACLELPLAPTR